MSKCAECGIYACRLGKKESAPEHCPMLSEESIYGEAANEYLKPENGELGLNAALTESEGYCKWTRLEEIVQFSRLAGFTRLGLAFCAGLRKEAAEVARVLKKAGIRSGIRYVQDGIGSEGDLGSQRRGKGLSRPVRTDVQLHLPGDAAR